MLCTQRADVIGVTEQNLPTCITNVGRYLQNAVDRWVAEKTLDVPISIDGKSFDVRFIPERTSSNDVAKKFCVEQAATLGVTQETFNGCVTPVSTYLQRAVNNFFLEKTLQVPVTVEGKTYQVSFLPERQTTASVANKLCVENAADLGVTSDNLSICIEGVSSYLNKAVDAWIDSKTLEFQVSVNQKPFSLSFMPERQSSAAVARSLCIQRAQEFGLTEETIVPNCVTPVAEYVAKQVEQWVESKKVIVPITVSNQTVNLTIFPERESSVAVARSFCVNNAKVLSLTNENIVQRCISPLNDIVSDSITKWAASRSSTVSATA